jgi:hypothetical protein
MSVGRGRMKRIPLVILVLILALGATAGLARAGSSSNYAIEWQALAGGGQAAESSGGVRLNGTLGQPITGASTSGDVSLEAGYWSNTPKLYVYYLLLVWR